METNKKVQVRLSESNTKSTIIRPYKTKGFLVLYKKSIKSPANHMMHLYFTSDEKIEINDWFYSWNGIYKASSKGIQPNTNTKKIIASTDNTLNLPTPSPAFIEKYIEEYNKGNEIKEVMVEYEYNLFTDEDTKETVESYWLKVSTHNEITIHPVKTCWTEDELYTHMQYYMEYCERKGYVTPMKWCTDLKHSLLI